MTCARRIVRWVCGLLLALPPTFLVAQVPPGPAPLWVTAVDGPLLPGDATAPCFLEAGAESLGIDAEGTTYIAGRAAQSGSSKSFVAAYDPAGTLLWVRSSVPGAYILKAPRLAVRDAGEPRVALVAAEPSSYEVIAYSSDGTEMWRGAPDDALGTLEVKGVGFTSSGAVVVASRGDFPLGAHLARFSGAGVPDWQLEDPELVLANGARLVAGDGVLVWGGGGGPQQVARYQVGGARSWLGTVPQPANSWDRVSDVVVDGTQRVFGTGDRCGASLCSMLVFALDATGGFRWDATSSPGLRGASLVVGLGGEIYVAGAAEGAGGTDGELARYSADGLLEWHREIDRNGGEDDLAVVTQRGDGAIQAVGTSPRAVYYNSDFLVATATTGGNVTATYLNFGPGEADEIGCGAVRSSGGGLTVIGQSNTSSDVRLAALTEEAAPIWSTIEPPLASPDDWVDGVGGGPEKGGAFASGAAGDLWLAARSGPVNLSASAPLLLHLSESGQLLGAAEPFPVMPPPGRRQGGMSVRARPDGGVAMTGYTNDGQPHGFVTLYDASMQQTALFQDGSGIFSLPVALFESPDTSYRVVSNTGTSTEDRMSLRALDATLAPLWRSDAPDTNNGMGSAERAPDGTIWMSGWSWRDPPDGGEVDCYTVGLDDQGGLVWEAVFGAAGRLDSCGAISVRDGRVLVGGYSSGAATYEAIVASYDTSGSLEWSLRNEFVPGQTWWWLTSVVLTPGGDAVISGRIRRPDDVQVPALARVSPAGEVRWSRELPYTYFGIGSLATDAEDFLYAATANGVVKMAPDGQPYWLRPFPQGGAESAKLALVGDGDLVAVGVIQGGAGTPSRDLVVMKLSRGNELFLDGFEVGDMSRWSAQAPNAAID